MEKILFDAAGAPAAVLASGNKNAYLFVHGKCGRKDECERFAHILAAHGFDTVAVDLPGHGENSADISFFNPWDAAPVIRAAYAYAAGRYDTVSVIAYSIGAYFTLNSGIGDIKPVKKALFVSPLTDMAGMIKGMMAADGVTEEELERRGSIESSFGETLSWKYLCFAREHENVRWTPETHILYGSEDTTVTRVSAEGFARAHGTFTLSEGSGHWFHTPSELASLDGWMDSHCGL